jgi:hypothetical protein
MIAGDIEACPLVGCVHSGPRRVTCTYAESSPALPSHLDVRGHRHQDELIAQAYQVTESF